MEVGVDGMVIEFINFIVKGSFVRIFVWFGLGIGNSISLRVVWVKVFDDKFVG